MNRKILTILMITGYLLSLAAACGKVDKAKRDFIACSLEIIGISKNLDPKSASYLKQLKQKVLEISKKHNFQGIAELKDAYKKYIKDSDPRLGEILQRIDNVQPVKISKEIPPDKVPGIDRVLEEPDEKKAGDEKSFLIGCERGDKGRVLYFLDKGVDINARDEKTGKTGLHYAAENFYTEIVKILLEKGADANIRTIDGLTPILSVVVSFWDTSYSSFKGWHRIGVPPIEIIDLLLNAGAGVNDQTKEDGLNVLGIYVLHSASDTITNPSVFNTEIARYLLEKGADINAKTTTDMEWKSKFFPAGSTILDIITSVGYEYRGVIYFLKQQGAKHGTWAKYYLEGKAKEDFLKSQEEQVPVKQAESGPVADQSKAEAKKDVKSPSEVVIAAYMAGNKGNYAETEKYIHSGFLAGTQETDRTQPLKKRWDKLTRDQKVEKIEILGQDIQEEGAAVYIKIHFKDGKIKVVKTQLIEEEGNWKIAALE